MDVFDHDFVVVGSGFGGSVAGLRLVEKGYDVLMLEQGREWPANELPHSNWNLRRWLWLPLAGLRGFFKMSVFPHVTVLSGVAVGGGSITYGSTHPIPNDSFFRSGTWATLSDWKTELAPHYETARRMLGVAENERWAPADASLKRVAQRRGEVGRVRPTSVAIYFGEPGKTVPDPYFDGEGPERTGCIGCGGCMLGCLHGAKNTLDKNYLWLARRKGLKLQSQTRVTAIRREGDGYRVEARAGVGWRTRAVSFAAKQVVLSAGVLGTVDLLLRMRDDPKGLPQLSSRVGDGVLTNSEALIGVVSRDRSHDLAKGIAIGSIYEVDERSHLEPVRYREGSGFFRLLMAPHVGGAHALQRLGRMLAVIVRHPLAVLRAYFVLNWAKQTTILLFMQTLEATLRLQRAWHGGLTTRRETGPAPTASLPEATKLAHESARDLNGIPFSLVTETLFNIPTTAHVLGGAGMGSSPADGVIDQDHRVFGYDGLYVMDGSVMSANPGVNPSLTITAMAERAVSKIAAKRAS